MLHILLTVELCSADVLAMMLSLTLSSALKAGEGLFGTMNAEVSVAAGTPGRSTG